MIYLDYNATTPLLATARDAMLPYMDTIFGNASSIHAAGRQARAAIDNARDQVAALLKVKPGEIIFTGGGTESNNLGILGLARCHGDRGKRVISRRTEHSAVRNTVEQLELEGFSVTWVNVSPQALIDLDHLRQSMANETVLVS